MKNYALLVRRAALDAMLSGVGPHFPEVSIKGAVYVLWENAGKPGHAQEVNASQMIHGLKESARVVRVPKKGGVLPCEIPQGGVRGIADGSRRVKLADHGDAYWVTFALKTCGHNVSSGRRHQLESASEQ